jgi:hypothetical protein
VRSWVIVSGIADEIGQTVGAGRVLTFAGAEADPETI